MNNDAKKHVEIKEKNPLLFWVAYLPGEDDRKNYLSDGAGHLRIYKTEEALREYLVKALDAEIYARVVVHSIQGQIAVPEEPVSGKHPVLLTGPALNPTISTLALEQATPSVREMLNGYIERRRKARRRSGKHNS